MKNAPDSNGILEAALRYAEKGLPVIPLHGKAPAVTGWQRFTADAVNLRLWFGQRGCNVGLRTGESGYVVVDTDTEAAEEWVRANLPESPMRVRSGSGSVHSYYAAPPKKEIRNKQGWKGIGGLDVRGQGGFIVLPPSVHPDTGKPYEWLTELLPPEALPRFSPAWIYERTRKLAAEVIEARGERGFLEYRAARWLEKVALESPAVSGAGGHNSTFRVANKLVHYFGLDRETAIGLMLDVYNPRCRPPWTAQEIEHKVDSAIERGHAP